MEKENGKDLYFCSKCSNQFTSKRLAKLHKHFHNDDSLFATFNQKIICIYCSTKFSTKEKFFEHNNSHFMECNVRDCKQRFPNPFLLGLHMAIHDGQELIFCPHCDYREIFPESLKEHIINIHSNRPHNNEKKQLREIILTEIELHNASLIQVRNCIEEEFCKRLSFFDNDYIEKKYIKYCVRLWIIEVTDKLKELTYNKRGNDIRKIFNLLDSIESLNTVPDHFKQNSFYKLLIGHYKLIPNETEQSLINKFKKLCLEHIFSYNETIEKELRFLKVLVEFLSSSQTIHNNSIKLKLTEFSNSKLSFSEFLSFILNLEVNNSNFVVLQEAAKCLQQEDLFLLDKTKEVIKAYIEPIEIEERKIDNRVVIEVKGKNVVLTKITDAVEHKLLSNSDIEEIRLIGGDVVHINTDLKNDVWHGKNVVVLTKLIKIPNEVIWNVSGKDNENDYADNAGTAEDGHGKDGKDGYAGESGGNVLILSENIENQEMLCIISNGGKGSKGQDGGNGTDGQDGKGIERSEFDEKYPSVVKCLALPWKRRDLVTDTIKNIRNDCETVEFLDDENTSKFVIGKIGQEEKIIFSNCGGNFTALFQAFLLYKGSFGQPGGHGGKCGLGGDGGFPGEIVIRNLENCEKFIVNYSGKPGNKGEKGQGGLYGSHGIDGWDMGYVDYQNWSSAKYYGRNQKSKCKIEYYSNSRTDSVWCAYKGQYAEISSSDIEHKKQSEYKQRNSTRESHERQQHARATRKKNILYRNIVNTYLHHLDSVEKNTLQDLQSDLDSMQQQTQQVICENQEQQERQTMDLQIKHQINFSPRKKYDFNKDLVCNATISENTKQEVDILLYKLKCDPTQLDQWFQLKNADISLSKLTDLFYQLKRSEEIFEDQQRSTEHTTLNDIKKLLFDKYKFASLKEIANQLNRKQLPTADQGNAIVSTLSPESAADYLTEANESDCQISHPFLGHLDQYLFEDNKKLRQKVSNFCSKKLKNTDSKAFLYSVRAFALEVGKLDNTDSAIKSKEYFKEYAMFSEEHETKLNIFFEKFKDVLSRPKNAELLDLWNENVIDNSQKSELELKIQQKYFLRALYKRINNLFKLEFDWSKCSEDQKVLKEYNDYILEKGPLSECYRELLAYIFDVNIRLYIEDQGNLFYLLSHHPSCNNILYVVYKNNKFIHLNIDEDYLRLRETRKIKNEFYGQILKEIDSFKEVQQFDDYLNKETFTSSKTLNKTLVTHCYTYSFCEDENLEEIIKYFPGEEGVQLKEKLNKLKSQYIGQQGILYYMLKQFSCEGRHVTSKELCCLVHLILNSVIRNREEQNIFWWIISAYPQKSWIDEFVLLQLENYYKLPIPEDVQTIRMYLSKITNKDILLLFLEKLDQRLLENSVTMQSVKDLFYLLSNIQNKWIRLKELELPEWPYALKEHYWSSKLEQLIKCQESELIPTLSYYLLSIENIFGTSLVEKLISTLESKKQYLLPKILKDILSNFHTEKWNLNETDLKILKKSDISIWIKNMQKKFNDDKRERNITQLIDLIEGNANTSENIIRNLPDTKDSVKNLRNTEFSATSSLENFIKNWAKKFNTQAIKQDAKDIYGKILKIIDKAIELKRGFKLRDTQILTVLTLLTNNCNTLAQVSTGEGKSLIVVAATIMKALFGEKVHIVTSSSVLAKRDAEINRDIYSMFDINVSHNCSEDVDARKEAYSNNQVIYGDLSNFQRDYLLDTFYGKNILGDHTFENIIVDEVDSMLLDKGNNMLYLSHDLAGMDKLESVYIYIWQWISRPAQTPEELSQAFNTEAIKNAVLNEIYGFIKKEDIAKLNSKLSDQQQKDIWERLINADILDSRGKLLKRHISNTEVNKILAPEFNTYHESLSYLLKECMERETFIHVPYSLLSFVEQHLESWINSAITAFFMKTGEDYVVDVDRSRTSSDRNPNIIILDRDVGTDQANSQWDEALHQFLQLKHGCKLSLQSLKAVFISNVSFFKLYSKLYGLTGTLGSIIERDLLRDIYGTEFVTIPPAKSKQFYEDRPILCSNKEQWINSIVNEAKKLTGEKKRSVLIICDTVSDVEVLSKAFRENNIKNTYTYTRDYEEFNITQGCNKLKQGQIIIATNLAGRGTDIKITKELKEVGGLHVCLTYLPNNIRIEQQAFGRAARAGDEGSGQLIITIDTNGCKYTNAKIQDLKKQRDEIELHRISDIKTYYETQISIEEKFFRKFQEEYQKLNYMLSECLEDDFVREIGIQIEETFVNTTAAMSDFITGSKTERLCILQGFKNKKELKNILLQSCLDSWAFWLDKNNKQIKYMKDKHNKMELEDSLSEFLSELNNLRLNCINDLLDWVKGNHVQMVKLGKYFLKNKKFQYALQLFDEIIDKELYFSEAAHYYKAFALAKESNSNEKAFKNELRKAAKIFEKHIESAMILASIVDKIKKNTESIIQINAYEEQKKNIANLYQIFSRSIDNILGHPIIPSSFSDCEIKDNLTEIIFEDLLKERILKKPKIKKSISDKEYKTVSSGFGISSGVLNKFLSGYRGKEINERYFQKALKRTISLPSREEFWKLLVERKVLTEENKYVIIDDEKLKKIDPSLFDFLVQQSNKLQKHNLEPDNQYIYLYIEAITEEMDKFSVYEKKDFVNTVGKDEYQLLKKKGILSFNKKARLDEGKKVGLMDISKYSTISVEDFAKINISKKEADIILVDLVKQKVIEQKSSLENNIYKLVIDFDKIEEIRLSSCPIYENAVTELFSVCFAYTIAFQKILRQLDQKEFPIRLHLMTKPHHSLVLELLNQKILKFASLKPKDNELEEKLKRMFCKPITERNFKAMLSEYKSLPSEEINKLYECLIMKGWITSYTLKFLEEQKNDISFNQELIANYTQDFLKKLNTGNFFDLNNFECKNTNKKLPPLEFSFNLNQMNRLSDMQNIDKTVKNILDDHLLLAKKDTITNIIKTLERSRSSLKSLKAPDIKLISLTEYLEKGDFSNAGEAHEFFLNGLEQLLQLEEQKWTREMLYNTAIVVAMGLVQIAVGFTIQLYSVGVMAHVGGGFISEGVNDIFFAASALTTGYFSWKDYRQHKLESLVITAFTVGLGAYRARGTKMSHFGLKIGGPNLECGGKKLAETCGKELMETVGISKIRKEFVKSFTISAIKGVSFGLANAGVDVFVENYLNDLCRGIASQILSSIEQKVKEHEISESLRIAYVSLGENEARQMVNTLTDNYFTTQNSENKFLNFFKKIASNVIPQISKALKKAKTSGNSKTSNQLLLEDLEKLILICKDYGGTVKEIRELTDNLLNELNKKIIDVLNTKSKKNTEGGSKNQKQESVSNYNSFKTDIIDMWKTLLFKKAEHMISQHIVKPILKEGANGLITYIGKKVQEAYRSYTESGYRKYFDERKQKYHEELQEASENENSPESESHITKKYHEDLLELAKKTRNPELFTDLIKENIPMDLTCVSACVQLLSRVLDGPGIVIKVIGEDGGVSQEFASTSEGREVIYITLELRNNHFQFFGSDADTIENIGSSDESRNNCLHTALTTAMPELNISPEDFRSKIADIIKNDSEMQYHIEQGWHQLPLSLNAFGGARNINTSIPINKLNQEVDKQSSYQHEKWKFNESKDVDLRKNKRLSNEETYSQLSEGFREALKKINQHLSSIDKKCAPVTPATLQAVKHDGVVSTTAFGEKGITGYPVEMETTVRVWVADLREYETYKISINLDNPQITPNLGGPHGPHIGYEITGRAQAPKGKVGHILLNENIALPDRGRSSFSEENSKSHIPVTRVFSVPVKPHTTLGRVDKRHFTGNKFNDPNIKRKFRDTYPSSNF